MGDHDLRRRGVRSALHVRPCRRRCGARLMRPLDGAGAGGFAGKGDEVVTGPELDVTQAGGIQAVMDLVLDAVEVGQNIVRGPHRAEGVRGGVDRLRRPVVDVGRSAEGIGGDRRNRAGTAVQPQVGAVDGRAAEVVAGDAAGAAVGEADSRGVVVEVVAADGGRAAADVDADGVAADRAGVAGDRGRGLGPLDEDAGAAGDARDVVVIAGVVPPMVAESVPAARAEAGLGDVDSEQEAGDRVAADGRATGHVRHRIAAAGDEDRAVVGHEHAGGGTRGRGGAAGGGDGVARHGGGMVGRRATRRQRRPIP